MNKKIKEELQMWVFGGGFIVIGLAIWAIAVLIGPKYQYFPPGLSAKIISLTAYIIIVLIGLACILIGLPTVRTLVRRRKQTGD